MNIRSSLLVLSIFAVAGVASLAACSGNSGSGGFQDEKKVEKSRVEKSAANAKPDPDAPPKFDTAVALKPAYDAATKTLTVNLEISEGYHAYADGEEIGMPVKMTVATTNGWAVEGKPIMPAGKKKDLGELGTSVILEGAVPLKATVSGGKDTIEGAVKVQVCTDKACDRPRQHKFSVKI